MASAMQYRIIVDATRYPILTICSIPTLHCAVLYSGKSRLVHCHRVWRPELTRTQTYLQPPPSPAHNVRSVQVREIQPNSSPPHMHKRLLAFSVQLLVTLPQPRVTVASAMLHTKAIKAGMEYEGGVKPLPVPDDKIPWSNRGPHFHRASGQSMG